MFHSSVVFLSASSWGQQLLLRPVRWYSHLMSHLCCDTKNGGQNSALKITISDVLNPEFPTYLSPVSFSFCGEFAPLQFKPLQPLQFRPPNVKQVRPAFTSSSQNLSTRFRTTYRLHFLLKSWYFCNQHVIFKWNQNKVWSPCKFLAVSKTHFD